MTILEKMDRLVYATRLDEIVFMKVQPRSFRWAPLIVFAILIAGYVLMANKTEFVGRRFLIGWALFYSAFLASAFLRVFGPRFVGTALSPVDERELTLKSRAHAVSGFFIAVFAMLGCFYMAAAGSWDLWRPRALYDWINLGFAFQAAGILLPTMIASWMQPRLAADLED